SSTGVLRSNNRLRSAAVPELPDLTIVAEAFYAALRGHPLTVANVLGPMDAALRGRPITAANAPGPLAVRGTPAELDALVGQRVTAIRRKGKFLEIDIDRDRVVVNPMLTGRFQLASPGAKLPTKTAVVLGFGERGPTPGFKPARW